MEEQNPKNFEPIQGEGSNSKKTNKLIFVLIAIIIVIVALIAFYALKFNTPRYVFDKKIDQYLSSDEENSDFNTLKFNADFEVSIDSKESEVKEVSELLNDAKFSFSTELNKEKQEELVGIKMSKSDEELINANIKLEAESKNLYINLGELFKKTIQLDISEISDESFEIADKNITTFSQKINSEKAEKILKKEIKSQLKDEYFSSEKATIDEENVTKNKLRMTAKQFSDAIKNTCKNLSENEEFINCFEDGETVKEDLEKIIKEVEDLEIDNEEIYIEIDVYTKGIIKNIKRVDLLTEEDDEQVSIQIKKLSDEEYEYKLFDNEDQVFEGTFKYKGEDNNFEFEISAKADGTEVTLKSKGNVAYDEELSEFDTSKAVNYQELTTEDMYEIVGNFMSSKLYKTLESLSNANTSLLGDDIEVYEEDDDEDNSNDKSTSNTENNVVKTYNDDTIKFNIPDGFEIYSSDSEYYKLFEKEVGDNEIEVDVSTSYETLDEYIEDVKEQEDYKDDENYKNYKVSDVKEIEVNGNKFKKIIITYDYGFSEDEEDWISYSEAYIACEIDKENIYTVEIDGADLISDNELEQFLTIEK